MGGRRAKALSLYRAILRTARTWEGGAAEQAYIREEAGALFRKNRGATDPETIDAKLFEASSRLELGVHYQIPYPRHYYMVQGSTAKKPAPLQVSQSPRASARARARAPRPRIPPTPPPTHPTHTARPVPSRPRADRPARDCGVAAAAVHAQPHRG